MSSLVVWTVQDDQPVRLARHDLLEKNLETWVQKDSSLVMESVRWIARQLVLPSRNRLDLLGLTPEGQLVIAELKAGPIDLATLHQALGYAIEIGAMDGDELLRRLASDANGDLGRFVESRAIALLLVGTSQSADLDQGIRFLQAQGLSTPIRMVTFSLFEQAGTVLLARQIDEREASAEPREPTGLQRVLDLARERGVSEEVEEAVHIAGRLDLPRKIWPASITINSPVHKRKTLLYVGPRELGCQVGYVAETFAEAFGVSEAEVAAALGANWVTLPKAEVMLWLRRAEEFTARARTPAA
jgi:hypothetical protein